MKAINASGSPWTISLIPRFDTTTDISMIIKDESSDVESTATVVSYSVANGWAEMEFTLPITPENKEKYSFKILYDGTEIVYRGKLFFTDQTPQEYKITKDLYVYE